MVRQHFASASLLALLFAGVGGGSILAAEGHGGGGGAHAIRGGGAGGSRGGFGPGFRGGYGYGYGYPGWGGFGLGLGLGYGYGWGYGYGYPYYGYPYGAYGYPYGYGGYPVYVNPIGTPPVNGGPPPGPLAGGAAPGSPAAPGPIRLTETDVMLSIHVPADAVVHINGVKTAQNGPHREFMSNGLMPGRTYTFTVVAHWTGANGEPVDLERRIPVQNGERRTVDFLPPPPPDEVPPPLRIAP